MESSCRKLMMERIKMSVCESDSQFVMPFHILGMMPKSLMVCCQQFFFILLNSSSCYFLFISSQSCQSSDNHYLISVLRPYWNVVKWVMKYLKGTKKLGILFERQQEEACVSSYEWDRNYAGNLDKRRSSYVFTCGGSAGNLCYSWFK